MKVNYSDLLDEIVEDSGENIDAVKNIFKSTIKVVKQHMLNCDEINILNFCKFHASEAKSTRGYNFQEKQTSDIPKRVLPKCEFVRAFREDFKKKFKEQA